VSHSGNPASLAYSTAQTRWPKIVVAAIADVEESLADHIQDNVIVEDGHAVFSDIKGLPSSLEGNTRPVQVPNDGASDVEDFNAELKQLGPIRWHDSPWPYCEMLYVPIDADVLFLVLD
jgi:hypothetical protein